MIKILDVFVLILYCLFLYWLSDQPSLPMPMGFEHQDKLQHGSAYFIMGLLAWRSLVGAVSKPVMLALFSIGFCSLYGVSDEWHQSFVEGRDASVADWIADTFGVSSAALLMYNRYKRA